MRVKKGCPRQKKMLGLEYARTRGAQPQATYLFLNAHNAFLEIQGILQIHLSTIQLKGIMYKAPLEIQGSDNILIIYYYQI